MSTVQPNSLFRIVTTFSFFASSYMSCLLHQ